MNRKINLFSDRISAELVAMVTQDAVLLGLVQHVGAGRELLLRFHALLMVFAWLGCAGSGIILARYFKDTWKNSTCCGGAQWFFWHRSEQMRNELFRTWAN